MNQTIPEYCMCMVGCGGVGKSSITLQFVQGTFVTDLDPTMEDDYRKRAKVDGQTVMLDILDTMGYHDEFRALTLHFFRQANGFLLLFSLTDRSSLNKAIRYLEMIQQAKDEDDVTIIPIILVGNNLDLTDERVISRDEATDLSRGYKLQYMEISAKMNENVTECFLALTRMMMATCTQQTAVTGQSIAEYNSMVGTGNSNRVLYFLLPACFLFFWYTFSILLRVSVDR